MAILYVFVVLFVSFKAVHNQILCEDGFCRTYGFEVGCTAPAQHCRINNATHSGISLPSPTVCNCCDYCLPFIVEGDHCSLGGPGTGTTVPRCGDGLTCVAEDNGNFCRRMTSKCYAAQDEYDARHELGQIGALEQRPDCDGKGRYQPFHCVPTQTCFCQSEEGERLFGEVLHMGAVTERNMHCGCSRLHEKVKRSISPGVPIPVIGLRCTSDGNFNPVQCLGSICYCVNKITGVIQADETIDLEVEPISELSCYCQSMARGRDNNDETFCAAAGQAQSLKRRKYSCIMHEYKFAALAVETLGPWSADMKAFMRVLSAHLIDKTGDPRAGAYLSQRISLTIQRDEPDLDLFPSNTGSPPYNYTSPCLEEMRERIDFLAESEQDGFNVDFFSGILECLPDGTYGRVVRNRNGSRICVDERGQQIEGYEATPGTTEYNEMNCNCALTTSLMESMNEKPVCCRNGNFRRIQCRRGTCRCVDSDGKQVGVESSSLADLACYNEDEEWRTC